MQYEGEDPEPKTHDYFLILNVHTGDVNRGFTRAPSGDGFEFEPAVSDRELMNTLRVIIVNQHTGKIAHNDFIVLPEASTIKEGLKYKVDFDTDYKVYLIANEEGLPDYQSMFYGLKVGNDYSDNLLEDTVIGSELPGQPMISDSQSDLCIPMTEIFDIKTSPNNTTIDESNDVVQNETFFITRATTKFSFYFFRGKDSKPMESDKLKIQKVKISGLGKNEYLFPYETTIYKPSKEANKTSTDRDITYFDVPEMNNGTGEYVFDLPEKIDVSKLPEKPADFDSNNPTLGLTDAQIFKYIPDLYFPESKGNTSGNRFECTISYDGKEYLTPVVLPNLPHQLPRNTHVVVIITVNGVSIDVYVDIQPFAEQKVRFEFGLMRDDRGDLMVLPVPQLDENGNEMTDENGETIMTYPQYFLDFINDGNPNHKYPDEVDLNGHPSGNKVKLEKGDYYAIVVGEYDDMSEATVWVKDPTGCHVLSNYESTADMECSARIVESFFGNNQSERFYKDIFGYRRVHHFDNHNSIVRHPETDALLFCVIENFQQPNQTRKYFEVESWDEPSCTGWIVNKDENGKETGFQKITPDGQLGESVALDGTSEGFGS